MSHHMLEAASNSSGAREAVLRKKSPSSSRSPRMVYSLYSRKQRAVTSWL